MRSVLNPTHFYKKNDLKTLPKYFQVGTVLPSPLDKFNDRGERVTKKKSLVDELLEVITKKKHFIRTLLIHFQYYRMRNSSDLTNGNIKKPWLKKVELVSKKLIKK